MIPFIEVLDRAHKGPLCEQKDWDVRMVPQKVKEKLKEYGLERTFTPENPVNTDDGLADDFWKAGFDLAVDLGMLCIDTRRVIKFDERELRETVEEAPTELSLGRGEDSFVVRSRAPEDGVMPRTGFGALGIELSNEIFVQVIQSIAQYRAIDVQMQSVPKRIWGREIRAGTPYETLAARVEAGLIREGMRRAGRYGMPYIGFGISATEYGQMGGFGIRDGPEIGIVLPITELKTSYKLLHKTAHDVVNHEGIDGGCHWSMIGGYVGPAEGAAVAAVAATLLIRAVHRLTLCSGNVMDMRYSGNAGRDAVWAHSVAQQAVNRNADMLTRGLTSQVSGPCTPELLYETAVVGLADGTSGVSFEIGTRPTGCKYPDYASGLENKFAAEIVKVSAGVKREQANEVAREFMPKYEGKLRNPPKGKSFTECTDLKTLQPTKEWLEIYNGVWRELEDLGISKDKLILPKI